MQLRGWNQHRTIMVVGMPRTRVDSEPTLPTRAELSSPTPTTTPSNSVYSPMRRRSIRCSGFESSSHRLNQMRGLPNNVLSSVLRCNVGISLLSTDCWQSIQVGHSTPSIASTHFLRA